MKLNVRLINDPTDCAETHNGHPSNNNLGTVNNEFWAAIQSGTFTGIYPGDYFYFTDIAYEYFDENGDEQGDTFTGIIRLMHLDYPQDCGYTTFPVHCAVVAPDDIFFSAPIGPSDTFQNGYANAAIRTVYLQRAKAIFEACFGTEHILSYTENLVDGLNSRGYITSVGKYNCDIELMTREMISRDNKSYYFDANSQELESLIFPHKQLAAYKHNYDLVYSENNGNWWTRNNQTTSSKTWYFVSSTGTLNTGVSMTKIYGVHPFALIGVPNQ